MNATLPSTRPVIAALSASLLVLVCPAAVTMPLRRDLPRAAAASLRLSNRQARARIRQGDSASGQSRPSQPRRRVPRQDAVELVAEAGGEHGEDLAQVVLDRARA